jgi:uncharacterized membrane protein
MQNARFDNTNINYNSSLNSMDEHVLLQFTCRVFVKEIISYTNFLAKSYIHYFFIKMWNTINHSPQKNSKHWNLIF